MAEFYFTRKAVEDLTAIWNYTVDRWSERQADEYYGMLASSCRAIAENPEGLGRSYAEVAAGLLGFKAGKHIIFYRVAEPRRTGIVRILQERMDIRSRLGEDLM